MAMRIAPIIMIAAAAMATLWRASRRVVYADAHRRVEGLVGMAMGITYIGIIAICVIVIKS